MMANLWSDVFYRPIETENITGTKNNTPTLWGGIQGLDLNLLISETSSVFL